MRKLSVAACLVLGYAAGCAAQSVRVAAGIAVAEAEYRDAVAAWSHADPDLAKDLLRVAPEEIRGRIRRVAALRDDAMVKKGSYLAGIVDRLRKAARQLSSPTPEKIPAGELKQSLPEERARIENQQESVTALLRSLPSGDEYAVLRRDLEGERDRLEAIHNDLAARYDALDALERAQDSVALAGTAGLAAKLDGVVKVWERERDDVERQRANWKEVYAAMERAVDAHVAVAADTGNAVAGKKSKASTKSTNKK